ncbi:hypothetical protein SISSUDRAFT_1129538 [Sistotremastrum suecicum HHB10207 ss-3]|uniref:CBM1 domain-containing protein n=1 Tax=Sistotremastrum suecicum HHB10207 ss-3 TaxID=1314776 RepID=A0A166CJ26_9AGAM|nr:hypothetical protein SISSUDRAFT_1129538 [Sistotremastrum suecicum HHB10207 ss-3]
MLSSSRIRSVLSLSLIIVGFVAAVSDPSSTLRYQYNAHSLWFIQQDDTPTPTITSPPSTRTSTHSVSIVTDSGYWIQSHYGQCGGMGYQGPDLCTPTYKCREVVPTFYSQCL